VILHIQNELGTMPHGEDLIELLKKEKKEKKNWIKYFLNGHSMGGKSKR